MADDHLTYRTPRRRWLLVALVVSLALNLVAAGMVAGWAARRHFWDNSTHPISLGRMMREGGEAERARARAVIEARRQSFDARREAIRAARRAVRETAASEPFSAAALSASLAALRVAETALAEERHGALVDLVSGLPADRRAKIAARLAGGLRR